MGDLNNDSNIGTWPLYYGDKPPSDGQLHNSQCRMTIADSYFGYHTENVRQKMLEHEGIFQNQLYELHRVYRVQREMMDDLKMNELQKQSMALETSMSSCSASQRPDAQLGLNSLPFSFPSSNNVQPAVVGAKDSQSIPDFLNGRHPQNGMVSHSNPGRRKNCEVEILECRPSTARRKFDLELQPDEYIDVEEPKYRSNGAHGASHPISNGKFEVPPSSSNRMLFSRSARIDNQGEEARRNNNENGLANLNREILTQGQNSSSLNFVGSNSNFLSNQQLLSKSHFHSVPWESMPNSHFRHDASGSRNFTMAPRENRREWSQILDSARSKGHPNVSSKNLLPENIDFFNKDRNESYFQINQIKAEHWRERYEGGPKQSRNSFLNRLNTPHLDKSFNTSKAPWESSGNCVSQKTVTAEAYPFLNSRSTFTQSLQSSSNGTQALGGSWHINSSVNGTYQNGFSKGSSSGSGPACCPTIGYDYIHRINDSYVPSGASVSQSGSVKFKGLTCVEASPAKGIDLNITCVDYDDRSNQDAVAYLPWMKSSSGLNSGNRTVQSSNGSVMRKNTGTVSTAHDMATTTAKMIMGVPIFGDSHLLKGPFSCRPMLTKAKEVEKNGGVRGFDMNMPCEYEEKDTEPPVVNRKNVIDLNMCVADDDSVMEIQTPCSHPEKTVRDYDLEASGDIEEEDMIQLKQQISENSNGSLEIAAAEAIVGILSCRKSTIADSPRNPGEAAPPDVLLWFVDIVSSCPDNSNKVLPEKSEEEIDYFESMTLRLAETKEEEYLPEYPKPPEPEEEMGTGLYTTRTRKGQVRRGRPRRDFQRDILPGLTSLARHEVTEDLQTFGGLMQATGHSWQSSLARRAGPRRGRPRLTPVQPPNPVSTPNFPSPSCSPLPPKVPTSRYSSLSPQKRTTTVHKEVMNMEEVHGNLTGWGKTTRRPRRQRYSAASVVQRSLI